MTTEFTNDTELGRYQMLVDGKIVSTLDYNDNSGVRAFNHTFTPPSYRGKGYAALLVAHAIAELEATDGLKASPVCWFVDQWFSRHPEKQFLLAERD